MHTQIHTTEYYMKKSSMFACRVWLMNVAYNKVNQRTRLTKKALKTRTRKIFGLFYCYLAYLHIMSDLLSNMYKSILFNRLTYAQKRTVVCCLLRKRYVASYNKVLSTATASLQMCIFITFFYLCT